MQNSRLIAFFGLVLNSSVTSSWLFFFSAFGPFNRLMSINYFSMFFFSLPRRERKAFGKKLFTIFTMVVRLKRLFLPLSAWIEKSFIVRYKKEKTSGRKQAEWNRFYLFSAMAGEFLLGKQSFIKARYINRWTWKE